jgi:phage FluMu protein gp41
MIVLKGNEMNKKFIIGKRSIGNENYINMSNSPVQHKSVSDARIEAERLAIANPGYEFIVFDSLVGVVVEPVVTIKTVEFN